ncbi:MAG: nitrilase-related carbon-nitrogen hydrolase, partial [Nanoarchaeota archaeon]
MKIALAQMEVVPGRPRKNLETMLEMIEEAKAQKAELVAFPELCVGGYLLGDKFTDEDYCANLMEFDEVLKKASEGIALAYGNVFVDKEISQRVGDSKPHPNKDGRLRKYNAVHLFQNGKEIPRFKITGTKILPPGVQPKTLLPNYRFFDDERYFFSLEDTAKDFNVPLEELAQPFLVETRDGEKVRIGFEVCEDLWCADYRRDGEAQNITQLLIKNGARYIVNISASPWTYGKNGARDRKVEFLASDAEGKFVPFDYVNCTGMQNN